MYGTISGTGLSVTYDAPAAVPSPATFNVTATSVADTTKSASVSVTITPAPAVAGLHYQPHQLNAERSGERNLGNYCRGGNTTNTAVTWTVNGITNGNATVRDHRWFGLVRDLYRPCCCAVTGHV